MGVHGLWRLIEPSGKPVPLETLENKVLAVDISIWLHQCVKGFQDSKGASVPNAHLLGIYHRLCKLLYFRIKPIFVFDGGVPALKRQTIAKRNESKIRTEHEATRLQKQLLNVLLKHSAVSKVLTDKIEASIGAAPKSSTKASTENMYMLPPNPPELDSTLSSSDDESYSETSTDSSPTKNWDLHTIDMNSAHFKALPADVRHEILSDLKETRKQSSWGRIHELPKVSDDFSIYQMRRLLKRQAVQTALEDAEKEMGGKCLSLNELELVLKDEGIIANEDVGNRIASDNVTKYVLVKDLKAAREEAKTKNEDATENAEPKTKNEDVTAATEAKSEISIESEVKVMNKADVEYEEDLHKAIALSLEVDDGPSASQQIARKKLNPAEFSFLENFTDADFATSSSEEEPELIKTDKMAMSSVQGYMLEYSGLTPMEIDKIMNSNVEKKRAKMDKPNFKSLGVIPEHVEVSKKENPDKKTSDLQEVLTDSETLIKSQIHSDSGFSSTKNDSPQKDVGKNTEEESEVEFMSSSDSSDLEIDNEPLSPKLGKGLEINININDGYDDKDDLFDDIFDKEVGGVAVPGCNTIETKTHVNEDLDEHLPKGEEITSASVDNNIIPEYSEMKKDEGVASTVSTIADVGDIRKVDAKEYGKDLSLSKEESRTVLKEKSDIKPALTEQELVALKNELHREKVDLLIQKSSKERIAGNITDKIYQEAQELLELFGVPYIIAPMEAEAQCAFLEEIDLTNGTITDDSDVWLFGAKTVYKNFFSENKYVKEFRVENIKHHFKLTRDQMILFALLVGSDYTVGLQGVGPVTAMEILSCFPPASGKTSEFRLSHSELLSGLKEFRSWFTKGKTPGPGRNALKSKLRNVKFTENFPSVQVVQAYLEPCVETSSEAFSWGKPNGSELIDYAMIKFGWTRTKSEQILNPVLKKLEEIKHQKTIKEYFKTAYKIHSEDTTSSLSKRVKSAITNMGRDPTEIMAEELEQELKKTQKKRPKKETTAPEFAKKTRAKESSKNQCEDNENDVNNSIPRTSRKRTKETNPENVYKKKSKCKSERISADPSTSSTKTPQTNIEINEAGEISEKINLIRRRRVLKQAKTSIVKEPKQKKEVQRRHVETIPENLKEDEEVNMLSRVLSESSEKAEAIVKSVENEIKMREAQSVAVVSLTRRPVGKPKKEMIPQKEKNKNTLLRNKLKAIETYRRSKRGPGYVPKKEKKKMLPKADAELSENSSGE